MRKFVFIEKLPSGNYSVRHWKQNRFVREWFSDYSLAKRRAADLTLKLEALRQGQPDPTIKPLDILTKYIEAIKHTHRPITLQMKTQNLTPFMSHIQYLTSTSIKEWKQEMLNKQLSISTVAIRLRDLKTLCKWAQKEGLLTDNVFETIQVPTAKESGRKLSKEELQKIWEAADTKFKPFLGFLIFTGARRGEILKAKWEHVDLDKGLWRIPADNCKTKRERWVPLASPLIALLRATPNTSEFVFPWTRHTPHHLLYKACRKAGVPHPRIHDFRHTFASFWNGDSRKLMDMVGWSSTTMLKRYSHFTTEDLRQEADQKGIAGSLQLEPQPKLKVV